MRTRRLTLAATADHPEYRVRLKESKGYATVYADGRIPQHIGSVEYSESLGAWKAFVSLWTGWYVGHTRLRTDAIRLVCAAHTRRQRRARGGA